MALDGPSPSSAVSSGSEVIKSEPRSVGARAAESCIARVCATPSGFMQADPLRVELNRLPKEERAGFLREMCVRLPLAIREQYSHLIESVPGSASKPRKVNEFRQENLLALLNVTVCVAKQVRSANLADGERFLRELSEVHRSTTAELLPKGLEVVTSWQQALRREDAPRQVLEAADNIASGLTLYAHAVKTGEQSSPEQLRRLAQLARSARDLLPAKIDESRELRESAEAVQGLRTLVWVLFALAALALAFFGILYFTLGSAFAAVTIAGAGLETWTMASFVSTVGTFGTALIGELSRYSDRSAAMTEGGEDQAKKLRVKFDELASTLEALAQKADGKHTDALDKTPPKSVPSSVPEAPGPSAAMPRPAGVGPMKQA